MEYANHIVSRHRNVKRWYCIFCTKIYKTLKDLGTHIRCMHLRGEYECSRKLCYFVGETRYEVFKHAAIKHDKLKGLPNYSIFELGTLRKEDLSFCDNKQIEFGKYKKLYFFLDFNF